MLTKNHILLIFFIVLFTISKSQNITIQNGQQVYIDLLDNIYITDKDNLSLISKPKKISYQNQFLGDIYSIDISNPLRILVFHKEANQIVFLNNELSIIGDAIKLDELNLPDVNIVCSSQINGFWLYNNLSNRIEYYDHNLKKIHTSINLTNLIDNLDDIRTLKMYGERIYLNVQNTGILVFDMFATYIKTLPIINPNSFQVLNHSILFTKDNQILEYDFDKIETSIIFQSDSETRYAKAFNKYLYYQKGNTLLKIQTK